MSGFAGYAEGIGAHNQPRVHPAGSGRPSLDCLISTYRKAFAEQLIDAMKDAIDPVNRSHGATEEKHAFHPCSLALDAYQALTAEEKTLLHTRLCGNAHGVPSALCAQPQKTIAALGEEMHQKDGLSQRMVCAADSYLKGDMSPKQYRATAQKLAQEALALPSLQADSMKPAEKSECVKEALLRLPQTMQHLKGYRDSTANSAELLGGRAI